MNTLSLRSLLWLIVATAFLFSCSKQEKDQIKPKASTNPKAPARMGSVLYEQLVPAGEDHGSAEFPYHFRLAEDFVVPATETWTIEEFLFYQLQDPQPGEGYHVYIYKDAAGLPGELIFTHSDAPATIQPGSILIDITDIQLSEGTYWVSLQSTQGYSLSWRAWGGEILGRPVTYNYGVEWLDLDINLVFTLLGTIQTRITIDELLSQFDTDVTGGTIIGVGKGKTAANNLNAFKNQLINAKLLLEANDLAGACTQLTDAQKRIHTGGKIRSDHFITGSGAGALNEMITALKTDLGCL